MVNDPFNMLKRPDDYDPEAVWRKYDLSKVRRYQSPLGFEYWLDIPKNTIRTSDPEIYLSFHAYYAMDYVGHSYAKLYFDGSFVVLTQDDKDPKGIMFEPKGGEKTEEGEQIWHIDQVFRTLIIPDGEAYPWVRMAALLPKRTVKGMDHFESQAQQDKFVELVTTLLSCRGGSDREAMDGKVTKGKVVFGEKLKAKLARGELIK